MSLDGNITLTSVVAQVTVPGIIQVPAMDNSLGALLIGCYCATALYGLVTHQVYRYFRMYPGDTQGLKLTCLVSCGPIVRKIIIILMIILRVNLNSVTDLCNFDSKLLRKAAVLLCVTTTSKRNLRSKEMPVSGKKLPLLVTINDRDKLSDWQITLSVIRLGFGIATTAISLNFRQWIMCTGVDLDVDLC
ncbi:hypothetical protein BV22DRAFT_1052717 [Leucogyrophana mollusca]|uniref:Uncharacterized protein n=1 Tax=Leucogyrophana mollusca TaxID=85980 RepID=A0ACB8AUW3_9AGAM|nr:hypothetical protein BV22DRAFT_1052717 [Leucogyrophana mollusca]